jgi:hypothetical protein
VFLLSYKAQGLSRNCHNSVARLWHCAEPRHMSAAKKALRKAVQAWREGLGPSPQILRTCDACGEERWRPLDRRQAQLELDAHLGTGQRADLTLSDAAGRVRLVVQLEGGSRLPNRALAAAEAPIIVLSGAAVVADPLSWRPLRERGLPRWRCRCALARPLPVDDAFSLRVIGCPLNLRREDAPAAKRVYASVIHDCARCSFFVGIGYADSERRRVSLYCAFGRSKSKSRSPLAPARIGPAPTPRLPPSLPLLAADGNAS